MIAKHRRANKPEYSQVYTSPQKSSMFTFKRRRNNTKNKEALESFTIMKVVSKNTRMFQKRKNGTY